VFGRVRTPSRGPTRFLVWARAVSDRSIAAHARSGAGCATALSCCACRARSRSPQPNQPAMWLKS